MSWIKVIEDPPPPPKPHKCNPPWWADESIRKYKNGSIWQCDEWIPDPTTPVRSILCNKQWKLIWTYGHGEDSGMPIATFTEIIPTPARDLYYER